MRRREFIVSMAAGCTMLPDVTRPYLNEQRPTLCFFSKHLEKMKYNELGKELKEAGFAGVDLTVRPGGHVLPERVAEDLPRAVEAIRSYGLKVPMITTGLTSASDPTARAVLGTAARLKIPLFKLGYWLYRDDVLSSHRIAGTEVRGLVDLARQFGLVAGFHNDARCVGLAIWDTDELIRDLDPMWIGYYYDAGNATLDGGASGWEVGLRLAAPRLKMAACKDFAWEKIGGQWTAVQCPLGEGMVNWARVFSLLAAARFTGPISIHQEYRPSDRIAAAHRDLEFVRKHLSAAYGGAVESRTAPVG